MWWNLWGDTGEGYQGSKGLCRSNVYEGKTHEVNLEVSIGREHLTGWCMKAGGRRVYPQELEVWSSSSKFCPVEEVCSATVWKSNFFVNCKMLLMLNCC